MNDYSATISVNTSPINAYKAIAEEMSNWWTTMSNQFLKTGDRAKTDFGGQSYWVLEATTLKPPTLIELTCCEAFHIHEGLPDTIKEEWLNTILKFEITKTAFGVKIDFTHERLNPSLVCYKVCEAGWNHYFTVSLKRYLSNLA